MLGPLEHLEHNCSEKVVHSYQCFLRKRKLCTMRNLKAGHYLQQGKHKISSRIHQIFLKAAAKHGKQNMKLEIFHFSTASPAKASQDKKEANKIKIFFQKEAIIQQGLKFTCLQSLKVRKNVDVVVRKGLNIYYYYHTTCLQEVHPRMNEKYS